MSEIQIVQKDGLWSWSGRSKVLLVIAVILIALVVAQFVFNKPVLQEGPVTFITGFTQELYVDGDNNPTYPEWNMVVFPYSVLLCCEDDKVGTVFESALIEGGAIWVFAEDENGQLISWSNSLDPVYNTLHTIGPYVTYWVSVEFDCTLQISCWD